MFHNIIKKLAADKFLSITQFAIQHIAINTVMTSVVSMYQDTTTNMFANQIVPQHVLQHVAHNKSVLF